MNFNDKHKDGSLQERLELLEQRVDEICEFLDTLFGEEGEECDDEECDDEECGAEEDEE